MKTIAYFVMLFCCSITFAQTTVSGTVTDNNAQPLPGANVLVVGTSTGAVSDFDGKFTFTSNQDPPFSVQASSVGFQTVTLQVISNNQTLNFVLVEGTDLDEIVISASRTPERVFESPVTIERFGIADIKTTPAAEFYDGLENLKGVDINTNSLTFKAINTRGFATFANNRFMQLIDGMDNSSPALNFPLGNLVGITETDVQSVELLPGAASALYGANAFNGILFMRSKNPFDFTGISGHYKQGLTSQKFQGDNTYTDFGIRMAYKFSDKFAAKVNFSYLKGTDWGANDYSGRPGTGPTGTRADIGYDGINVYGDEIATNIRAASGGLGIIPDVIVSRTGYVEEAFTNYNAESAKVDWAFHYRPWATDFEIIYQGKIGTGSTIYQGSNRYNIDGFNQEQHKLELKNNNFFLRGYVVSDGAGDSYDMFFTSINILNTWKPHEQWFEEYITTYAGATLGGATDAQAHAAARAQAETGRYEPGTPEFEAAFNRIISDPDVTKGSKFQDASKYYHADANYNFSHLTDIAEIQVGGSFRNYILNSFGTIYTDGDGSISYSEFGIYTQIQKEIELNETLDLKLTGSVRYDKAIDLFDGFVSPRIAAGLTINKNHNIRASYQTGFRNPSTQDLYIGLNSGFYTLVGSAPDNLDRYSRTYSISQSGQNLGQPATVEKSGGDAYTNSYLASSVSAFAQSGNPADLEIGNSSLVQPEKITSYEVGYRGKLDKVTVDLNAYYNQYTEFNANELVISPYYGTVGDNSLSLAAIANGDYEIYQTYTNSEVPVNSYGGSIGASVKLLGTFDLGANYTYTKEDFDKAKYPDFRTNFNTPEHKAKATFGSTNLIENFGFNVAWRWNDDYYWQNSFADGPIRANNNLDAQINLSVPSLKSTFKVGATNVLGAEYTSATGTGYIGSMYYASWIINNF